MRFILTLLLGLVSVAFGQPESPFSVQVKAHDAMLELQVDIPANHYLYVNHFEVTQGEGMTLAPQNAIPATSMLDPVGEQTKAVYSESFVANYPLKNREPVTVSYMGCNDQTCFLPQSETFRLDDAAASAAPAGPAVESAASLDQVVAQFEVKGVGGGYKSAPDFLALLDKAEGGGKTETGFALFLADPVAFVRESGLVLAVIFILLGGLALNLTPCVLPMIPINLAIIGAGAQAGSKRRGFALGAVYGVGIALVYGLLGVAVVLTGSQFGTLQSSPWFSLTIAAIFVVLGLAMFDVLQIDFTNLQNKLGKGPQKSGSFWVALAMGSVAALLAGACVAPVGIAVLLLATNLDEGNPAAGLLFFQVPLYHLSLLRRRRILPVPIG